ncbi:MAG: NAD(P)-dependent oxidoreductase [Limisphaerales bacterium]
MAERIAFVGVGRMGANMARRLKDCGYPVTSVYDLDRKVAGELAGELGAAVAGTLAEVTASADVVFTVVTNDKAMAAVFGGRKDSLLKGARGKVFVNCATLSPAVHRDLEKRAAKVGAETLEACMASSIPQARQGTLYLMCGGKASVFDRLKPILTRLTSEGSTLRHIGAAGKAAEVKALVNMVMNINTAGLAEGLALGDALGLDLGMLREVFSQTGANSRVLQTDGEDMQNRDHSCFFSADHAAKDSGIALALGRQKKMALPLAEATLKQFQKMVKEGLGGLDKSGIAELTFKGRHRGARQRVSTARRGKGKGEGKGKRKA